ncbi:ABC transporter permease [Intestinimonas aquisgranensis]|uniref:ABC transporter permease n=1 Tax=Intestinimonas timonensis TaxID=1689270 RepID=UPI001D0EF97F|nr:ABC transporter permease [Intestinimonas timonensis]MCC2258406.1 ABC transporter permease [Intestinimonas aquisgranensis]
MSILESLELALKNIVSSKTRTVLTMLGIIIGVAAVIVIVGLGNGLEQYVTDSFSDMGTNTLTVTVMSRGSTRTLSVDEMYEIVDENSQYLDLCSPTVTMPGYVKIGSETITSTSVQGVSEDYFSISGDTVASGRGLQYSDMAARGKVCVIGAYLNLAYYGGNAVGQTLRVGGQSLTIVGVLAQTDEDLEEGGSDDCIYLPYTTASRLIGDVSSYIITMQSEDYIDESVAVLESALYEVFASDDYYTVTSMSEMLETMTSMINILVGVLAGIAAISLVVGGIGIMNIMLVSVTERTREIGIRKSLGAKERYIMQQFVIEAACTSALGGIIGILLGDGLSIAASTVVTRLMEETLTVAPTLSAVALAFGISVGIGILFGYLPAKKAAGLNPIDALHYD